MNSITVLITCYREGELLFRAVESLRKQTDRDFSILVVNDASEDEITNRCCRNLQEQGIEVLWRKVNGGLSAARNDGFEYAQSDIIVPLDADDTLPENAVELIKKTFEGHADAFYVFGNYNRKNLIDFSEKTVDCHVVSNPSGRIDYSLILNNWILLGLSPCRKELWEMVNGYSIEFSNTLQDMDFWLKVFEQDYKGIYMNRTIYNWHVSPEGMNAKVSLFDIALIKYRHLEFYLEFGGVKKRALVNDCFNLFYSRARFDLVIELAGKYIFNLSMKNILRLMYVLNFRRIAERKISNLNQKRKLY